MHRLQYSTVQYSVVQYSTVQYSTVQYSTVQCEDTTTVRACPDTRYLCTLHYSCPDTRCHHPHLAGDTDNIAQGRVSVLGVPPGPGERPLPLGLLLLHRGGRAPAPLMVPPVLECVKLSFILTRANMAELFID